MIDGLISGPVSRSKSGSRYTIEQAQHAALLIEWLATKRLKTITSRQVCQFGPATLRRAAIAKEALALLEDYGYVARVPDAPGCYDVGRCVWHR